MMATSTSSIKCICSRLPSKIMCCKCSEHFEGRIYRSCPIHPRKIHLMDITKCVKQNCHSDLLIDTGLTERKQLPTIAATEYIPANILGPPPGFEPIFGKMYSYSQTSTLPRDYTAQGSITAKCIYKINFFYLPLQKSINLLP